MPPRKPKSFRVTLRGRAAFPIDMLRYDRAVPASETDAAAIERSHMRMARYETVTVDMPSAPTVDRWKSFWWDVTKVEEQHA